MLRNAIISFNENSTEDSWLDIMELLRDSYVWIPCVAIPSQTDIYYDLGKDIVAMKAEQKWGSGLMKNLGIDLREQNPDATCFSDTNIRYMKNFYLLYHSFIEITPQAGAQLKGNEIAPQVGKQLEDAEFTQQVAEKIENDIFSIPWGHHKLLLERFNCSTSCGTNKK